MSLLLCKFPKVNAQLKKYNFFSVTISPVFSLWGNPKISFWNDYLWNNRKIREGKRKGRKVKKRKGEEERESSILWFISVMLTIMSWAGPGWNQDPRAFWECSAVLLPVFHISMLVIHFQKILLFPIQLLPNFEAFILFHR